MKIDGNTVIVGRKEWAKSEGEEGFGVVAVLQDGTVKIIGTTKMSETKYTVPERTVAIARPILDQFLGIKKIEVNEVTGVTWQTPTHGFCRWVEKLSAKWRKEHTVLEKVETTAVPRDSQ